MSLKDGDKHWLYPIGFLQPGIYTEVGFN